MWVLKLGGSLAGSMALEAWLDAAVSHGGGRLVVVPGGGSFADGVRRAQGRWGLSDIAAHEMALSAMDQMAWMMWNLTPDLVPVWTGSMLRRALEQGRVPVWLPAVMLRRRQDIPPSWDVTSDSLSVWLAGWAGAKGLLLVKSVRIRGRAMAALDLVRDGVVDPALPGFITRYGVRAWCAGADAHDQLAPILDGRRRPYCRILGIS